MPDVTIDIVLVGEPSEPSPVRAIGTEFERKFPPDLTTTDWERSTQCAVYTYRVVAHRLIARFPGDTVGELWEQIEPIGMYYEEPEGAGE